MNYFTKDRFLSELNCSLIKMSQNIYHFNLQSDKIYRNLKNLFIIVDIKPAKEIYGYRGTDILDIEGERISIILYFYASKSRVIRYDHLNDIHWESGNWMRIMVRGKMSITMRWMYRSLYLLSRSRPSRRVGTLISTSDV